MRVIGAGLPRTGTYSLRLALEQLLGGRCYHMYEARDTPHHVPVWHQALLGEAPDWEEFLGDYVAAVDWPAAAFWRELTATYPNAVVLLSTRDSAEQWWDSIDGTLLERRRQVPQSGTWGAMADDVWRLRFSEQWKDPQSAMAAYGRYNNAVRSAIDSDRLVEWQPGDGWEPICRALDLPVPDAPFPRTHSTARYRAEFDLDGQSPS